MLEAESTRLPFQLFPPRIERVYTVLRFLLLCMQLNQLDVIGNSVDAHESFADLLHLVQFGGVPAPLLLP